MKSHSYIGLYDRTMFTCSRIVTIECRVPLFSLTHCLSVISNDITISHILANSKFFGLHFCRRQYGL